MSMSTSIRSRIPAPASRQASEPVRRFVAHIEFAKPALAAPQPLRRGLDPTLFRDGLVSLEALYLNGRIAGRLVVVRHAANGSSAALDFPAAGEFYVNVHVDDRGAVHLTNGVDRAASTLPA